MDKDNPWRRRRTRLGISVNKLAELVGIRQSAMRMIDMGVNNPRKDTAAKLIVVLDKLEEDACPTCHRAFLANEEDDNADSEERAAKARKKGEAVSDIPARPVRRRKAH